MEQRVSIDPTPTTVSAAPVARRHARRDSLALGLGSAFSGLLAYAYFSLATRALGAGAAAPVSVLWTYWTLAAAALTFPVQHWVIRSAAALGSEEPVRRSMGRVWMLAGAGAVCSGGLSWLIRVQLFGRDDALFPVLLGLLTLGSCFVGVVRGVLSARERFPATAAVILGENAVRVLLGLLVALVAPTAAAFGAVLVAGQLVGLACPGAIMPRRDHQATRGRAALALAGGIAGGSLLSQVVLTAGPLALALAGGTPAEVTVLFAALALLRAPYILALGIVTQVTGQLTQLVVSRSREALGRVLRGIAIGTLVAAAAGALGATSLGNLALRLLFGEDVELQRGLLALVGAGTALALGNLGFNLLLTAYDAPRDLLVGWTVGTAGAVLWVASGPGEPLTRVVVAFLVGELGAWVVLVARIWRLHSRSQQQHGDASYALRSRSPA